MQCRRPGFDPWVREDPLEEGMATYSSILPWRIPLDRGAWRATVAESDTTERLSTAQSRYKRSKTKQRPGEFGTVSPFNIPRATAPPASGAIGPKDRTSPHTGVASPYWSGGGMVVCSRAHLWFRTSRTDPRGSGVPLCSPCTHAGHPSLTDHCTPQPGWGSEPPR